jgi:hypothetical protein
MANTIWPGTQVRLHDLYQQQSNAYDRQQAELAQLTSFPPLVGLLGGQLGQQARQNPLAQRNVLFDALVGGQRVGGAQYSIPHAEIRPGKVIMFTPPESNFRKHVKGKWITMSTRKRIAKLEAELKTLRERADGEKTPEIKNPTITALKLDNEYVPYYSEQKQLSGWSSFRIVAPRPVTTEVPLKKVVDLLLEYLNLDVASVEYSDVTSVFDTYGGTNIELIDREDD